MDFDFANFSPVSPTFNIDTSGIEQSMRAVDKFNQEKREREQRQLEAMEATANNTAETNNRLNKVIDNQNEYIETLKKQIELQKQQLEASQSQLQILTNIFTSGEDDVAVEKEIMKLIQSEVDEKHPLWDYVKDKGGDIAVAGVTTGVPVLYKAFKAFLATKGIVLL